MLLTLTQLTLKDALSPFFTVLLHLPTFQYKKKMWSKYNAIACDEDIWILMLKVFP